MKIVKSTLFIAAAGLLSGLVGAAPAHAYGIVTADARMAIGDLRISFPDDPDAFLVWADFWYGEVTAYAQDTDTGSDSDHKEFLYGDINGHVDNVIEAEARTAHVYSLASQGVADGENVGIDPAADVGAATWSTLELEGKHKQADGFANANFDNFFYISSPNPVGTTITTLIELDYAGLLDAYANEFGFFEVFAGAFLALWEVDQPSGEVTDLLDFNLFFDEAAGTNTAYFNAFDGTLSITADLVYDDIYWLYAEADSEVYGAVPVPATLPLLLLWFGLLAWRRRR